MLCLSEMSKKQNSLMRFSRTERLAQLSEQEIVIEKKKREIEARLEARRKKQCEEALKVFVTNEDLRNTEPEYPESFNDKSAHNFSEDNEKEKIPKEGRKDSVKNAFSNDGSFLDQFKKLSRSHVETTIKSEDKRKSLDSGPEMPLPSSEVAQCTSNVEDKNYSQVPENIDYSSSKTKSKILSVQHPVQVKTEKAPKIVSDTISMTFKSNAVKKLELISNPLNDDDEEDNDSDKFQKASESTEFPRISPAFINCKNKGKSSEDSHAKLSQSADSVVRHDNNLENDLRRPYKGDPAFGDKQKLLGDESDKGERSHSNSSKYETSKISSTKNQKDETEEKADKFNLVESELVSPKSRKGELQSNRKWENNHDGYQADAEDEPCQSGLRERNASKSFTSFQACGSSVPNSATGAGREVPSKTDDRQKRKRKSRWGDAETSSSSIQPPAVVTKLNLRTPEIPSPKTSLLSQLTRNDPGLIQYARQTFGSTNLSEEDWKKAEDHYKINLLYQDLVKKRAELDKLEKAGKFKYEYDSDEDVEGGTWEHKLRQQEMMATQLWAEELTRQAAGKHHIGDFLPPEELEKFMEKYNAVKEGREPDLSDYKEFKLKEDNVGYRLLQKMGWNEGQGLGQDGSGITHPVNKATTRHENQGLGIERPDGLEPGDDEYDAYRKRMMLAYRFRPNPLNNPRRPYY